MSGVASRQRKLPFRSFQPSRAELQTKSQKEKRWRATAVQDAVATGFSSRNRANYSNGGTFTGVSRASFPSLPSVGKILPVKGEPSAKTLWSRKEND
jgi:hypothetical protein